MHGQSLLILQERDFGLVSQHANPIRVCRNISTSAILSECGRYGASVWGVRSMGFGLKVYSLATALP